MRAVALSARLKQVYGWIRVLLCLLETEVSMHLQHLVCSAAIESFIRTPNCYGTAGRQTYSLTDLRNGLI